MQLQALYYYYYYYVNIMQGMNGAQGLPIGVQVVAPRYQEELCLRVMKELETRVSSSLMTN